MKRCGVCHKWKDETEFYFRNDRNKYRNECKECWKKLKKEYRNVNNKKYMKKYRDYYEESRKRILKYAKEYRETHKKQRNEYIKNRRIKDSKYKLNLNISREMRRSLKNGKNGNYWEKLVGYSLKELIQYLEERFTLNMSWENYGSYWEIDHIIPVSVFNFSTIEHIDFKRCWALKNLRPLKKTKNMQKRNKINEPFQPSLNI